MKILILGGGISGLSAAWQIQKTNPKAKITLLEKEDRLGGCIGTHDFHGDLIEEGPRTFAVHRSPHLLELISELGLQEECIFSTPAKRYLWHRGKLRSFQRWMPRLVWALCKEAFLPSQPVEDESIYDFALRKFNRKLAEEIFDPMTLGIYAGDSRALSLRSCFPFFANLEKKRWSVLRGLWGAKKGARLFSLQRGMYSLIESLEQKLNIDIVRNCPVTALFQDHVEAGGRRWDFDHVISALPGAVLGKLAGFEIPTQSLWVVHLAFKKAIPTPKGFGYLVPTKEKEPLLGMIWDSSIFPRKGTVYTAMVREGGDASWAEHVALDALRRHLRCDATPDLLQAVWVEHSLPRFEVGYLAKWEEIQKKLKRDFPSLSVVGNYIDGVSVDACLAQTLSQTQEIISYQI